MRSSELAKLLDALRELQRGIRARVVAACESRPIDALAEPDEAHDEDTIYAIDRVSEDELLEVLEPVAARFGGIVLIAEGLSGAQRVLPHGTSEAAARHRLIVDPIDGTRGLMYQKRSAWVLSALAPNRGPQTSLSDVVLAVQTEIPLLKQHLCDELFAIRGEGARAERHDRVRGTSAPLVLAPSRATGIAHGFSQVVRFFPGVRDELAAIDDEIVASVLGAPKSGKAACFEDQYASTGGELYELGCGHDRFTADLRPLLAPLLTARGLPLGLCCHPYDVCTALIARELGVVVTDAFGRELNVRLDLDTNVAWVGYANVEIQKQIEPALQKALRRRGLWQM